MKQDTQKYDVPYPPDPSALFAEYDSSAEATATKSVHVPNYYARNLSIDCSGCGSRIEVQEDSFLMTRRELVLLTFAFANIKQHDNQFEAINIPLIELCRLAGSDLDGAKDYAEWVYTIRRLATRTLNYVEDDHAICFSPYFSTCRVDRKTKIVTLKLNPDLAPYFLCLDRNKTIFLYGYLRQLSSVNSCLFYLLCASSKTGEYDLTVSIEHLKAAHGFKGETKHFLSDVLLPSIYEINHRTDLSVSIAYVKQGRSISAIRFVIGSKSKKDMQKLGIAPTNEKVPRGAKRLTAAEKETVFASIKGNREINIGRLQSNPAAR